MELKDLKVYQWHLCGFHLGEHADETAPQAPPSWLAMAYLYHVLDPYLFLDRVPRVSDR
jgi:hypothetical protein